MSETSMVERVARAMCRLHARYSPDHTPRRRGEMEKFIDWHHGQHADAARAAIAALREPTDEMLAAAVPFPEHLRAEREDNPDWAPIMEAATMAARMTVRRHWIDLIDAALSQ